MKIKYKNDIYQVNIKDYGDILKEFIVACSHCLLFLCLR